MLQLQRASAGSGKTYTLAKKFIEYFISVREQSGERRLRRKQELRDSLCHILAITFTNKATNEMKLRIVSKLDALAGWTPAVPVQKVDYLADFAKEFNCPPQDISDLCRDALKVLLSDYGDFKVSTIDSFFQTVLRTFAFEADLDDTYQIELDSEYVAQMGLDTTLDAIESGDYRSQGLEWINDLMETQAASGTGWNIFQKKNSERAVYGQVLNATKRLDSEDFKEIRSDLDEYFENYPDFYSNFHKLEKIYETDLRKYFEDMRSAAIQLRFEFANAGLDMEKQGGQYLASRSKKMAEDWKWDTVDKMFSIKLPTFTRKGTQSRVFDPRQENPYLDSSLEDELERIAVRMYDAFDRFRKEALSPKLTKWRIYKATLPYLGLLQSVRGNSRLFLTDSNTVQLSETNSILNRIIGKDDAPFIYERLGNRLNHFLIDEFQDTSRMQWANLHPLLSESDGNGFDNLIIGDAKQSIYRFRNADPTLITEKVPSQFADTCMECGASPTENTNWRSSRRIVEFNNLFFRYFTRLLSPEMEKLYFNTIQPPHHQEDGGYVQVKLFKSSDKNDSEGEGANNYEEIPLLIADMLRRGYAMRDIAVLVDIKAIGAQVIASIMAYNRRDDVEQKIDFVSADTLKIGESPAVQAVVAILEAINTDTGAKLNPEEVRREKGAGFWSDLKADFSFFARQHPDWDLPELLNRFLKGEYNPNSIQEMIDTMSTTVLPALVENIIRNLISERMRVSETPFIAAFMDSVLDFCEGSASDIASFLVWWNSKGRYLSISSPEDVDAVQIMTVHKSKGLEFRCVIVPCSKQTTAPVSNNKLEWLWVEPDLSEAVGIPKIPWLPVWSKPNLLDTVHAKDYEEYVHKYLVDNVNMAYVAYTRAIDELYIFAPVNITKDEVKVNERIGGYLWQLGRDADSIIDNLSEAYPDGKAYLPPKDAFAVDSDSLTWSFGEIPDSNEVRRRNEECRKNEEQMKSTQISEYHCSKSIPKILYCDPAAPSDEVLPLELEEPEEEETEEMRVYGDLMHCIMQYIDTPDDVDKALLKVKARGLMSFRDLPKFRKEITESLEKVKDYGWFAPGLKIINERPMAHDGKMLRPDRIIIHDDGTATIVDYKFGVHRRDKDYSRQVVRYANILVESGLVSRCDSYVWYVSLDEVLRAG